MDLLTLLNNAPSLTAKVVAAGGLTQTSTVFSVVTENSNLNEVIKASDGKKSIFIKRAPEVPISIDVSAPPQRNLFEAKAIDLANEFSTSLVTPACIFLSEEHSFFAMTSVGDDAQPLIRRNEQDFDVLFKHAEELANWLLQLHGGKDEFERPAAQSKFLSGILYDRILSHGIMQVAPDRAGHVLEFCKNNRDELMFSDFWGKNLLALPDDKLAIIDFEGVMPGDGAGDIAALYVTALFCCIGSPQRLNNWLNFCELFREAYCANHGNKSVANGIFNRVNVHLSLLIAHRTSGSFQYPLSEPAKNQLNFAVRQLLEVRGVEAGFQCILRTLKPNVDKNVLVDG